jgi:predicted dehydrogenase
MEKPFTATADEARRLLDAAERRNLKITAGHNAQFTHAARRMRKLVAGGYLGGEPVHLEGYYCYSFGDRAYARAVLGDRGHWVRKLPGGLLQNIICHGISKIAEFLPGSPLVLAHGFTSRLLESLQEDIIDELRVIIHCPDGPAAYFTFSSQISPVLHQLRVYGPRNGFIVDDDHQTLIKIKGRPYKSYLNQFLPPLSLARQYAANVLHNAARFIKNDFHPNAGMGFLIGSLYRSVLQDGPPPIAHREILLTCTILDSIFEQLPKAASTAERHPDERRRQKKTVLRADYPCAQ